MKNLPRRTKYEIWVAILEVCLNSPRHQSWILRELSLKTNHAKQEIEFLLHRKLLNEILNKEDNWPAYQTSLKGKKALTHFYRLISNFFNP